MALDNPAVPRYTHSKIVSLFLSLVVTASSPRLLISSLSSYSSLILRACIISLIGIAYLPEID